MTEPEASRPSGSHRRTDGTNKLVVLIASLVGIAIVAFLVVFALHKRGEPANRNAPASASKTTSRPATTASGPLSPSSASPSSASSPTGSIVSTASPSTGRPTPTPSASPSTSAATGSPSGQGPTPAIDVLNDSRITGLAAQAAAQFRAAGWDVASTGNFRGSDVPASTIFYPAGERAAAERLAAVFRIRRVLPAPADLSESHLTVVVARDWASRG